jgi:nicotinamide-nucleotide amidase
MTKKIKEALIYILEKLGTHQQTISVAESCSGGYLSYLFTFLPGSSAIFSQGFVTYTNTSKVKNLQIEEQDIEKLGAVSPEIAILMSLNVKTITKSNFGIGLTGNAGPAITEKSKQIGEVYVAISSNQETVCYSLQIEGTRDQIRKKSSEKAIDLFASFIKKATP